MPRNLKIKTDIAKAYRRRNESRRNDVGRAVEGLPEPVSFSLHGLSRLTLVHTLCRCIQCCFHRDMTQMKYKVIAFVLSNQAISFRYPQPEGRFFFKSYIVGYFRCTKENHSHYFIFDWLAGLNGI